MNNTQAKTMILVGLVALFLTMGLANGSHAEGSAAAQAEAEIGAEAGTTPGSIFYGFDTALDRLRLALAGGADARAEVGLKIAQERLLEARELAAEGNTEQAARARAEHRQALQAAQQALQQHEAENAEAEARFEARFEKKLKAHQVTLEHTEEEFESEAEVRAEFRRFDQNMDEVRAELRQKRNRTAAKMRAEGRSGGEVRAEFEAAAEAEGLPAFLQTMAADRLDEANNCLDTTEDVNVSSEQEVQYEHMVNVAIFHRDAARAAFDAELYGKAFGRATASWQICRGAKAFARGEDIEDVREAFEEAQKKSHAEERVSIHVSCEQENGEVEADVEVEIDRNGIEEEIEFDLNVSSCPPDRERVIAAITAQTSLTEEEVRAYIVPGLEVATDFRFEAEAERERWQRLRQEMEGEFETRFRDLEVEFRQEFEADAEDFEEEFRNRTAGTEYRIECDDAAEDRVEVGVEEGDIEVDTRAALNHGGYAATVDVDTDAETNTVTVNVDWQSTGQSAIQCLSEGRTSQDVAVGDGEWTVRTIVMVGTDIAVEDETTVTVGASAEVNASMG